MKAHHSCPVQATINVLSGKWKVQAVWRLSFGPLRFAELRDLLRGVSEKVLVAQLRELEKDGVISRTAVLSSPPKFLRVSLQIGGIHWRAANASGPPVMAARTATDEAIGSAFR